MAGIGFNFKVDMTRLNRAIDQVSRESRLSAKYVVEKNAQNVMRKLAYETPKSHRKTDQWHAGNARAGWWPAWTGLRLPGTPYTRIVIGSVFKRRKKGARRDEEGAALMDGSQYTAAGRFEDGTKADNPYIIFANSAVVMKIRDGKRMPKFWYLHANNEQWGWFQQAIDAVAFDFEEHYQKMLAKHSAGKS